MHASSQLSAASLFLTGCVTIRLGGVGRGPWGDHVALPRRLVARVRLDATEEALLLRHPLRLRFYLLRCQHLARKPSRCRLPCGCARVHVLVIRTTVHPLVGCRLHSTGINAECEKVIRLTTCPGEGCPVLLGTCRARLAPSLP